MRQHTSVEDVLKKSISFEDMDSWIVLGIAEDGSIVGDQYWKMEFDNWATTLLELLYQINPNCYCDENEKDGQ